MIVYEKPLKDGLRDIVAKTIRENGIDTDIDVLFDGTMNCTSAVTESTRKSDPPIMTIACEAGCSHCCYQYDIGVTPFEILNIAKFIQETYSENDKQSLLNRIATAEERKSHQEFRIHKI